MKAICIVAHPDDCIIFAYGFIYNHPEFNWEIVYLTHREDSPRGQEIKKFWNNRKIKTSFLGYPDNIDDQFKNHQISFNTLEASNKIRDLAQGYDLILTHNYFGDYGHIHHQFINFCLTGFKNVVTFKHRRPFYKLRILDYKLPSTTYDLSEVPLHADAIQMFHRKPWFGNFYYGYSFPKDLNLSLKILISKIKR